MHSFVGVTWPYVAYLRMGFKSNIILVDWSGFSQPELGRIASLAMGYPRAVKNVPAIGKQVSAFLMFLITERVLKDPTRVHIVGFSLGAEVRYKLNSCHVELH